MLFPVGKTQSCPLTVPGKHRGAPAAPVLQRRAEGLRASLEQPGPFSLLSSTELTGQEVTHSGGACVSLERGNFHFRSAVP